jgi:hypothetical protein
VRPEGLDKLKKITSSGLEPATFRLVALSLNYYGIACQNNNEGKIIKLSFEQAVETQRIVRR